MRSQGGALLVAAGILLACAAPAYCDEVVVAPGDPPVHVHSGATCRTDGGVDLRLPPGYYLPEQAWDDLDRETRRLQDQETRLTAENGRLRALTDRTVVTTLAYVGLGVVVGLAGGIYFAY